MVLFPILKLIKYGTHSQKQSKYTVHYSIEIIGRYSKISYHTRTTMNNSRRRCTGHPLPLCRLCLRPRQHTDYQQRLPPPTTNASRTGLSSRRFIPTFHSSTPPFLGFHQTTPAPSPSRFIPHVRHRRALRPSQNAPGLGLVRERLITSYPRHRRGGYSRLRNSGPRPGPGRGPRERRPGRHALVHGGHPRRHGRAGRAIAGAQGKPQSGRG